jgi:hypothetical protein
MSGVESVVYKMSIHVLFIKELPCVIYFSFTSLIVNTPLERALGFTSPLLCLCVRGGGAMVACSVSSTDQAVTCVPIHIL